MPNYQGSPNNLRKEPPKWKHLPTKAIRVPEVFADRLLDSARELDNGETERTPEPVSVSRDEATDTERTPEPVGTETTSTTERTPRKSKAIAILTQALELKANSGGAIKAEIRRALKLLVNKV